MNKFTNTTQAIYDKVIVKACEEEINLTKYGKQKALDAGSNSRKVIETMYNPITPSTSTLTEGVNPSATDITKTEVAVTPSIIGAFTEVSEELKFSDFDPTIGSLLQVHTRAASSNIRAILLTELLTTTNVLGLTAKVTFADIQNVAIGMANNSVPKVSTPAGLAYLAFVTPTVAGQIRNLDEYKAMNQYGTPEMLKRGEVGMLEGIYFLEVNDALLKAVVADTDAMLVLGADAFVEIGGQDDIMKVIKSKELAGGALNMFSTVGVKAHYGASVFEDKRIMKVTVKTV